MKKPHKVIEITFNIYASCGSKRLSDITSWERHVLYLAMNRELYESERCDRNLISEST